MRTVEQNKEDKNVDGWTSGKIDDEGKLKERNKT